MSTSGLCPGCGIARCNCACGCDAPGVLAAPVNRAGLSRIVTRLGGHAAFLAAATQVLSSSEMTALRALGTREASDPMIALLDGWAMIADILTFYRDRFANEAYLRTASEDISLRALAAQVGYRPRPGVSASVALAYMLDPTALPATIAAGARAQSVPKPGEQMQSFETMQPLAARAEWSAMTPRQTWTPPLDRIAALTRLQIRLASAQTVVRPGDRLLFVFDTPPGWQVAREVAAAKVNLADDCIEVTLKPRPGLTADRAGQLLNFLARAAAKPPGAVAPLPDGVVLGIASYLLGASTQDARSVVSDRIPALYKLFQTIEAAPAAALPAVAGHGLDAILAGAMALAKPVAALPLRRVADALGTAGGTRTALLASRAPEIGPALYSAWRNLAANGVAPGHAPQIELLRRTSGAFGSNAPGLLPSGKPADDSPVETIDGEYAFLDGLADAVQAGSLALIDAPAEIAAARLVRVGRVRDSQATARSDYGLAARVTRLDLVDLVSGEPLGLTPGPSDTLTVRFLRQVLYVSQSEPVRLAPETIAEEIAGDTIMLDSLYPGLIPGRKILIAGTRSDIVANGKPVPGVAGGELAEVAAVSQQAISHSPGDTPHTLLQLTAPLNYRYQRSGATIYGNVVTATHGETVSETLGSGDASRSFQSFALRRAPLTFVPAATTSGVADALQVTANGLPLSGIDSIGKAGPGDRVFQLSMDAKGAGTIEGGDGISGMRLPGGAENIAATYRVGIGRAGNVDAGQISLLATRPLGVRDVINPLRASGGADSDGSEAIRRNTPVPALALSPQSRLVSVEDYAFFARAFAGIGDVRAAMLSDGRHRTVFVTVAGVDDAPIDAGDLLMTALAQAYARFGDPALPVEVSVRDRISLLVQARVTLTGGVDRGAAEAAIRAVLGDRLGFARRGLARPAYRSEVIALIQSVAGVEHVEIEVFGGIDDTALADAALLEAAIHDLHEQAKEGRPLAFVAAQPARPAPKAAMMTRILRKGAGPGPRLLPAQTAYLRGDVADTLIINWS